ncbi:unnamed protein product [Camellia sinensis]
MQTLFTFKTLNIYLYPYLYTMAKVPVNTILLLSRRAYTVAAESVVGVQRAVVRKAAVEYSSREAPAAREKEVFWMRDPKSGNWIPETHFDEVDVAELREKLLPRKK